MTEGLTSFYHDAVRRPGWMLTLVHATVAVTVAVVGALAMGRVIEPPVWTGLHWGVSAGEIGTRTEIVDWHVRIWAPAIAAMALASVRPMLGLVAYLALAHMVVASELGSYRTLILDGPRDWGAVLLAAGAIIWQVRERRPLRLPRDGLSLMVVALVAWTMASWAVAEASGRNAWPDYRPARSFLHGLVVFFVASRFIVRGDHHVLLALAVAWVMTERLRITTHSVWSDARSASYLAMSAPLIWIAAAVARSWWVRLLAGLLAAYAAVMVLRIESRGSLVAASVGAVVWAALSRWAPVRLLVVGLGLLGAGWYVLRGGAEFGRIRAALEPGGAGSLETRQELWSGYVAMFLDHPWFGVGPGQGASMVRDYNPDSEAKNAHNTLLSMLGETGLIGAVLMIVVIAMSAWAAWRAMRLGWPEAPGRAAKLLLVSLVVFGVVSLTESRHDVPLVYLIFGWCAACWRQLVGPDAVTIEGPPGLASASGRSSADSARGSTAREGGASASDG